MGKSQKTKTVANTKEKSSRDIPKWLTSASKDLTQQALDLSNKEFVPYEGDRVAELTGDQQSGFQMVRDMISGAPALLPEVLNMLQSYGSAPAQQLGTEYGDAPAQRLGTEYRDAGAQQLGTAYKDAPAHSLAEIGPAYQLDGSYAAAPAQNIGFERVVDENGSLGAIADYMNPYQANVIDSAIRRITEAADKSRLGMNSRMTMAGAFGDAQHGVEGSRLNQDYMTAVGDTAGGLLKAGYDDALGRRTSDVSRKMQADVTNAQFVEQMLQRGFTRDQAQAALEQRNQELAYHRDATQGQFIEQMLQRGFTLDQAQAALNEQQLSRGFAHDQAQAGLNEQGLERGFRSDVTQAAANETALQRLLQSASGLQTAQGVDQNQQMQRIAAILGSGNQQFGRDQAEFDADYQDFLREMGWDADSLRIAASVIGGVPHDVQMDSRGTTNSTTTQPDNSMWQLAGTMAGALMAPMTGGMSLLPSLGAMAQGGLMPATTSTFPV